MKKDENKNSLFSIANLCHITAQRCDKVLPKVRETKGDKEPMNDEGSIQAF